jgi:hypothetical protein
MDEETFWCGDGQVRRLASLHVATGAAAVGALLLGAVRAAEGEAVRSGPTVVAAVLAASLAAALLAVVVLLGRRSVVRRGEDDSPGWTRLPLVLAALGLAGSVGYALLAEPMPGGSRSGTLPGMGGTIAWLFVGQFLTIVSIAALVRWRWWGLLVPALAGIVLLAARYSSRLDLQLTPRERFGVVFGALLVAAVAALLPGRRAQDPVTGPLSSPAWYGQGAPLLLGIGWLVGVLYSAGALLRLADYLNRGNAATSQRGVAVPTPLTWSSAGLAVASLLPLAAAAVAWAWTNRRRRQLVRGWLDAGGRGGTAHEKRRFQDVAGARAVHDGVERYGLRMLGLLTLPVVALLAAGAAGGLVTATPAQLFSVKGRPNPVLGWISDVGTTLTALLFLGLVAVGYLAYRNDTARRTIGITWDLSTFWPRAAHPFAPPCYAERVVPQLITRICGLPRDRYAGIVLAGHSQGSTIAVATVRQLPARHRDRVYLLTFGTQLDRLYGRVFPAFFGPEQLRHVAGRLCDGTAPRWTSLHRDTDPIGFAVDVRVGEDPFGWVEGRTEQAADGTTSPPKPSRPAGPASPAGPARPARPARPVTDPAALPSEADPAPAPHELGLAPADGEIIDPPMYRHSDYPRAREYVCARDAAVALLRGATRDPQPGG